MDRDARSSYNNAEGSPIRLKNSPSGGRHRSTFFSFQREHLLLHQQGEIEAMRKGSTGRRNRHRVISRRSSRVGEAAAPTPTASSAASASTPTAHNKNQEKRECDQRKQALSPQREWNQQNPPNGQ